MNKIVIGKDFKCYDYQNEIRHYDIDNKKFDEEVETAWFGDTFADKIFYIERYKENSNVLKYEKDLEFKINCNIQFKNIISYIRQWNYCTVKVVMLENKIIQVFIYPNIEINTEKELLTYEICAGYGDEMFVRYNSINDTFVPCGGIIGRKVKAVSVAIG